MAKVKFNLKGLISQHELMTGKRLTVKEVAEAVAIQRPKIYRLIAGKGSVKLEQIANLCKYFGCGVADLIKIIDD